MGNFSDTSSLKFLKTKGSIGHAFTVCIHTENQNQRSFYPFVLHEISVLIELLLGHLCYRLTDVPPQPNSPNGYYRLLHLRDLGSGAFHPRRLRVTYSTPIDEHLHRGFSTFLKHAQRAEQTHTFARVTTAMS